MKTFGYAVAVGLMFIYFVFIVTRMARSDGAKQTLAVLAIAMGGGVLAAIAGVAATKLRR